jgi:ParB/RepB/Spo0J family partition protein
MPNLITVALASIVENPVALRAVNRESEDYLGLVDSIREKGFLGAITVRPTKVFDPENPTYELLDGLHRFNAAKDAGIDTINVDVTDFDNAAALEYQIMANVHKIETRPMEYSKQLLRILALNPLMTESELATKLGKSAQWIKERLQLTKIDNPNIKALVDDGKICLSNAYALAKLPAEEMASFVDQAMTLGPDEFVPRCNERVKEIRAAKRQGADKAPPSFTPVAHIQKTKDIKSELETGAIGEALIASTGATTAMDGWTLGIQWVLHMDPESVKVQEAQWNEQQAERERKKVEAKAKKAKERAEKAAAEAAAAEEAAKEIDENTEE